MCRARCAARFSTSALPADLEALYGCSTSGVSFRDIYDMQVCQSGGSTCAAARHDASSRGLMSFFVSGTDAIVRTNGEGLVDMRNVHCEQMVHEREATRYSGFEQKTLSYISRDGRCTEELSHILSSLVQRRDLVKMSSAVY